jgi:hypothetical protein
MGWKDLLIKNPAQALKEASRPPKTDQSIKRREKVLAGLDTTIAQLKTSTETAPPRAWFSFVGDLAKVTVKVGNKIVRIEGADYNAVPRERASDFYKDIRGDVVKGELDKQLEFASGLSGTVSGGAKPARAGWSPERRAKQEATIKARNASKA